MRKLGIMFIINTMSLGGSESYVLALAKELKRRGHKIVVLSSGGELVEELTQLGISHYSVFIPKHGSHSTQPVVKHNQYALSVMASSMKRFGLVQKPWNIIYKPLVLALQLRKIVRENGIDIINSQQPGPTLLAYLVSKVARVPFVITVHGTLQNEFPPIGLRFMRKKLGRIIVISEETKEYLIKNYGIDEEELSLIPNGIDLASFCPQPNTVALNASGIGGSRRVVHIGGSAGMVSKSVAEAARLVVQQVPDVEFVFLGAGAEIDEATTLARQINQQVGREVVKMAGVTKDVIKVMNTSEVVIAVGRSALEAMACGKPAVIAGHRTGPLGGSFGGIISSDNVSELEKYNFSGRNSSEVTSAEKIAGAVIKLLKDEKYRQETGTFGRKTVAEKFDIQKVTEQIEKVYLEVLEGC